MTEEQRQLCMGLLIDTRGQQGTTKEEFVRRFPSALEHGRLSLALLEAACSTQDPYELSCALLVGFSFGFGLEHKSILCRLIDVDWHYSHENIVEALRDLGGLDVVEPLFRATQWIPSSLDYDDSRALAVKAIWALGGIPGAETEAKLEILARSEEPILRENALYQLQMRHDGTR